MSDIEQLQKMQQLEAELLTQKELNQTLMGRLQYVESVKYEPNLKRLCNLLEELEISEFQDGEKEPLHKFLIEHGSEIIHRQIELYNQKSFALGEIWRENNRLKAELSALQAELSNLKADMIVVKNDLGYTTGVLQEVIAQRDALQNRVDAALAADCFEEAFEILSKCEPVKPTRKSDPLEIDGYKRTNAIDICTKYPSLVGSQVLIDGVITSIDPWQQFQINNETWFEADDSLVFIKEKSDV